MGETTMMKTALVILLLAAFAAALPGEETSYDPAAVVAEQAPDMEQISAEISVDENAGNPRAHIRRIRFLLMHLREMQKKLRASREKVKNLEDKSCPASCVCRRAGGRGPVPGPYGYGYG